MRNRCVRARASPKKRREAGRSAAPGLELSYMYFASNHVWETGIGGFGQAFFYGHDDRRYALGLQTGSLLGAELGFAYRTSHGDRAATPSAHLGLYLSLAVVTMSVRTTLAFAEKYGDRPTSGNELALVLGLKVPMRLHGEDRSFRFMGGG